MIRSAARAEENITYFEQHLVTRGVSVGVIDWLEVIKVDHHEDEINRRFDYWLFCDPVWRRR